MVAPSALDTREGATSRLQRLQGRFDMDAHPKIPKHDRVMNNFYSAPDRLQNLCCQCGYKPGNLKATNNYPPVCSNCGKVPRWFLHKCVSCGEFFIKDFANKKFCALYPHCWDCLPKLEWDHCPDHYGYDADIPPVGMNPKKFSQEELDEFAASLDF